LAIASVVLSILIFTLGMGVAPNIDTRLVELGEHLWPGYARDIRPGPPPPPECNLEALEHRAATCNQTAPTPETGARAGNPDLFGGDDPFADKPQHQRPDKDLFGGDDPFAPPSRASGTSPPADSKSRSRAAPPSGEVEGDLFAEPTAPTGTALNCAALRNLVDRCRVRHEAHDEILGRMTPANQLFRRIELLISSLAWFPYWRHLLACLVVLGGLTTTLSRKHIALRTPRGRIEHRVSEAAQLVANGSLAFSCAADTVVQMGSSAAATTPLLSAIWAVGFLAMMSVNVVHLARPPENSGAGHRPGRLLMVVPLYAYLSIGSGVYFLLFEHHWSGQAIYLHKFAQVPAVYLGVGLYIWAGVLFSLTRVARLVFAALRPWGLPPPLLAWLVVVLAAFPTAYSGASGIFVMAAGAVIFEQLREAGASPRLALATTAMSGSLGVVLRPCLVVVLIATLNKQVTTADLYGKGLWVFGLTSLLFLVAMLARTRLTSGIRVSTASFRESLKNLLPLLPYAALTVLVWIVYAGPLGTHLSERTAALILPAVMLVLVIYERWVERGESVRPGGKTLPARWTASLRSLSLAAFERLPGGTRVLSSVVDSAFAARLTAFQEGLWHVLVVTTEGCARHVGALLMLMASSVCLGGVVERMDLMGRLPESFGTPGMTMLVLVVVMVLVGMTMDPLGAVVLVSVSLATVAYRSGIDPVHFWMMVLVAFELGYLTPPVSLNHLLARQVIGDAAQVELEPASGWFTRYEHIFIPMIVMGTALILVAFVPLAFY